MGIIDDDNESFLERLSEEKTRDSKAQKVRIPEFGLSNSPFSFDDFYIKRGFLG